jgi:hypothetical protein
MISITRGSRQPIRGKFPRDPLTAHKRPPWLRNSDTDARAIGVAHVTKVQHKLLLALMVGLANHLRNGVLVLRREPSSPTSIRQVTSKMMTSPICQRPVAHASWNIFQGGSPDAGQSTIAGNGFRQTVGSSTVFDRRQAFAVRGIQPELHPAITVILFHHLAGTRWWRARGST